ncbi:hypothetical protein AAC387_Pa10g1462 [Persea americana]
MQQQRGRLTTSENNVVAGPGSDHVLVVGLVAPIFLYLLSLRCIRCFQAATALVKTHFSSLSQAAAAA